MILLQFIAGLVMLIILITALFFIVVFIGVTLAMLQAWIVEAWQEWRYGYYKRF